MENPKDFHLPVRGPKICPIDVKNKSLDKEKLLEDAKEKINQHKALFSISSPRHLRSVAEFKNRNEIEIKKRLGKMFLYFGTQTKHSYKLLPEEALYLLEMNYLELQWNSIPMSVQQAYAVLLDESDIYCKLKHYRIYSHLLRQGYRLIRHEVNHDGNIDLDDTKNENPPKKQKVEDQETIEFRPLIDESVVDINTAMQRLQIFNTSPTPVEKISFIYNGYNPQREFSKNNIPPEPDLLINYACSNDTVPTISHSDNKSETKYIFALEATKDVVYYSVKHVSIQNLL